MSGFVRIRLCLFTFVYEYLLSVDIALESILENKTQ